jgi:hypothetical protein
MKILFLIYFSKQKKNAKEAKQAGYHEGSWIFHTLASHFEYPDIFFERRTQPSVFKSFSLNRFSPKPI